MPLFHRKPDIKAADTVAKKFGLQKINHVTHDQSEYYIQDTGTCGLATLLMTFQPVNHHLDGFFNKIWNKIAPLFESSTGESKPKEKVPLANDSKKEKVSDLETNGRPLQSIPETPKSESEQAGYEEQADQSPEPVTRITCQQEDIKGMEDSAIQISYRWQKCLEWLLFQVLRKPELQAYLSSIFGDDFTDIYQPKLAYRIKMYDPKITWWAMTAEEQFNTQLQPEDLERITGDWITRRYQQWKEDFELIILAALFGFLFIPYENSNDGTGALFFLEEEQKGKNKGAQKKKIKLLESHLEQGGILMLIEEDHWKLVKKIVKKEESFYPLWVVAQDPLSGRDIERAMQSLFEQERFYFFYFSEDLQKKTLALIESIL